MLVVENKRPSGLRLTAAGLRRTLNILFGVARNVEAPPATGRAHVNTEIDHINNPHKYEYFSPL